MLLELAIGDAYGAGFEYVQRSIIQQSNTLTHYVKHPTHGIRAGYYTDDTQMSLAIAEAIISQEAWTPIHLANRFVDVFKRDPRQGYAGSFYKFLREVKNGTEFLEKIIPTSDKSGAAMRSVPIGIFSTISEVLEKASIQAQITHNTPHGIQSAQAVALMTHYFLYKLGAKKHLGEFLETHVEGQWATAWQGEVKSKGWMSVRAAITVVQQYERLSDMLRACIEFGGDVDTVATIALGASSCSQEVQADLPDVLIDTLEKGRFGYDYLVELDKQLEKMAA